MMVQIEIIEHPRSVNHVLVKVITRRQLVYAVSWAKPPPSVAEVQQVWRSERHTFRPYDEATGLFVGGR